MKRVGPAVAAATLTALTLMLSACGGGEEKSAPRSTGSASMTASPSATTSPEATDSSSATVTDTASGATSVTPSPSASTPVPPTPSSSIPATPAFIKAVAQGMFEQAKGTTAYSMSRKQSRCVAKDLVEAFGTDRLLEWGVSQKGAAPTLAQLKLTEDEAGRYFDSLSTCGVITRETFIATTLAGLGQDGKDAAVQACLESTVDEATLRSLMIDQLLERGEKAPSVVEFQKDFTACVS